MKTSIASVCLSGPLVDKLQAAANAGFGGMEIFENDLIGAPQDARTIGKMMRDLGLNCTIFQPFRDLEGMPDAARDHAAVGDRIVPLRQRLERIDAERLRVA